MRWKFLNYSSAKFVMFNHKLKCIILIGRIEGGFNRSSVEIIGIKNRTLDNLVVVLLVTQQRLCLKIPKVIQKLDIVNRKFESYNSEWSHSLNAKYTVIYSQIITKVKRNVKSKQLYFHLKENIVAIVNLKVYVYVKAKFYSY